MQLYVVLTYVYYNTRGNGGCEIAKKGLILTQQKSKTKPLWLPLELMFLNWTKKEKEKSPSGGPASCDQL